MGVRGSADAGHVFGPHGVGAVGAPADPFDGFALGMPCAGAGFVPVLADAQGRVLRLDQWQECPQAQALALVAQDGPCGVQGPLVLVYDLQDERDRGLEGLVSGFLVECARRWCGGDGQDEVSLVACRPGVAEAFDLKSDAFMPVVRVDGDGLAHGHVPHDGLRGLVCAGAVPWPASIWRAACMAGPIRAAPVRRLSRHAPMSVGRSVPSSWTGPVGIGASMRAWICSVSSRRVSCASISVATGRTVS